MLENGISIIICCYNSASRLPETLNHIAALRVPDTIKWEIIVVNNASTDNTKEVAQREWDQYACSAAFKIVDEHKIGLSSARMKGIGEARYEYFLFCDDDNWLDDNYIELAYTIMEENPFIGVLGGQSEGVYEGNPPDWFIRKRGHFAIGEQNEQSGDLTQIRGWVWGAASIYRKQAIDKIRALDIEPVLSDRKGNKMSTGGDIELCFMIRELGYKIWYDDRLKAKHYMPAVRYSLQKFNKLHIANGIGLYLIFDVYLNNLNINLYYIWKLICNMLFTCIKNMYLRNEDEIFNFKNNFGILKGYFGYRVAHATSLKNKEKIILSRNT